SDPLELQLAEALEVEAIADQLAGPGRDHDRPWGRDRLYPRCQVWRRADNAFSLGEGIALGFTDHHEASGDPGAGRQHRAIADREPSDRSQKLQRRPHGPLGVVLVGPRPAEVDHRTVAEKLGDVAVPAVHDLLAAVL